ncbi:MAG TPA: type II toxin-antitoxin system VapC family toxin [Isosphaeraceae bacterium]
MSLYLLDSKACIQSLRNRDPALIARFQSHPAAELRLCSVVIGELYYGAYKSPPAYRMANLARLAKFVAPFLSLPDDDPAAEVFGRIRADVASRGVLLVPYDLQIAAIALVHSLTLVTHNTREFSQVPGLTIEDWRATP